MKSTQTSTSDDEVEAQADATAVSKISPEKIIPYRWVRVSLGFLWMFTKWAARSLASAFGARAPGSSVGLRSNDRIQALRVWDPPEFSLAFFWCVSLLST
jgi:hypothetical protein